MVHSAHEQHLCRETYQGLSTRSLGRFQGPTKGSAKLLSIGLSDHEKKALVAVVDNAPYFNGQAIAFVGRGTTQIVRPSPMPRGLQTWIVIEEKLYNELFSIPHPPVETDWSAVGWETGIGFLNCASTVIGVLSGTGTAVATPFTGGSSAVLSAIIWTGTAATGLQCVNSSYRVYNELFDPETNRALDDNVLYQYLSYGLDIVSISGAAASAGKGIKAAYILSKTTGKSYDEVVGALSKAERDAMAKEMSEFMSTLNKQGKLTVLLDKGMTQAQIMKHYKITKPMLTQVIGQIATAFTFRSSAMGGMIREARMYFLSVHTDSPPMQHEN